MRSRTAGLCLVTLMAVLFGCATTGSSDAPARIRGRVLGPSGEPLDGVRITTEPPTDAVLTFDGTYEITREVKTKTPISPGVYTVLPYKLGWWAGKRAEKVQIQYVGGDLVVPDIRLQPIGGPTMDNLKAPVGRRLQNEAQGSGVIRDGE